ncbi:calcium-binding protein [Aliishimia ponticola]|uniref:Calcium-binding protein n=1 Tax=Aliishimia ponticola TaxID=2499833 RepID=A0A4V3XK02_9RHOB|nr:calcium-binding protein [Aliishimia ponticola]THH35093.1 calcium-binding protein [Aliishimia ponticola]
MNGGPGDDTITLDFPLQDGAVNGSGGFDTLDLGAATVGLFLDIDAGYVRETLALEIVTFEGFEAYTTGAGDDFWRIALDTQAPYLPIYDAGAGDLDVLRIMEMTVGATDTVQSVSFGAAGSITGTKNGTAATFAETRGFEVLTIEVDTDLDFIGSDAGEIVNMRAGGDNHLQGFGGDDHMMGGRGNDIIDGGAGSDTALYNWSNAGVTVYLEHTDRDVGGDQGRDILIDIENLTGSGYGDRLVGDAGSNVLSGLGGDDLIIGKGGDDFLFGHDGNDELRGGDGADQLTGGEGEDVLFGLAGDDMVFGDDGDDYAYGGRGNDLVFGGQGADRLRGNRDSDDLYGERGADDLRGGGGADGLYGGEDNDFLLGGNGADVLVGGSGSDVLIGGAGGGTGDGAMDTFVFGFSDQSGDDYNRIKDFEDGLDMIALDGFGFTDFATDILPLARDTGFGLRLDLDAGYVVLIEGVSLAQFDAGDVVFS